jgi:hypothetical protein
VQTLPQKAILALEQVDREIAARTGAVRALEEPGQSEGMLLLRLKALLGDDEEIMIIGARKATRSESL